MPEPTKIIVYIVGQRAVGATTSRERAEAYAATNPLYSVSEVVLDDTFREVWPNPFGDPVECFVEDRTVVEPPPLLVAMPDFMKRFLPKE